MNRILPIAAVLLALGCTEATEAPSRVQPKPLVSEDPAPPPGTPPSESAAAEREVKAANAAPVRYFEDVDWPAAADHDALPDAWVGAHAAALQAIRLPVLLPFDQGLVASAEITSGEGWYGASMKGDDLTVFVRGRSVAHRHPAMRVAPRVLEASRDFVLSRTHGIVTVSWREFGVSYGLDIECLGQLTDARCANDDFALQMMESLRIAGGQP